MEIFSSVLAIWILIFGVSVVVGKGGPFAKWSWGFVTRPFKAFWGHYGNYILVLLLGAALGLAGAPTIYSLLRH